jgi:hypothetical protein
VTPGSGTLGQGGPLSTHPSRPSAGAGLAALRPAVRALRGRGLGSATVHAGPSPSSYTTHAAGAGPDRRHGLPRAAGSWGRSRPTDPVITNTGGGARDQAFGPQPAALTQPKSQAARRLRARTSGSGRRRALFLYNGVAPGISPGRPASPPARAPCVNKHIHPAAVSLRSASRARSLSLGRWRVTKEGARGLGTGSSQQRSSDHNRQH